MTKMTDSQNSPETASLSSATLKTVRSIVTIVAAVIIVGVVAAFLVSNPSLQQAFRSAHALEYLEPKSPNIINGGIAVITLAFATFAFVPVLALYAGNAVVFGPFWGSVFSIFGVSLAGAVQYLMGRVLHEPILKRLRSGVLTVLRRKFSRAGPWPIAVIRVVPAAPFVVVNVAAGALRIRFADFFIGNLLGSSIPIIGTAIVAFEMRKIAQTQNLKMYLFIFLFLCVLTFLGFKIRQFTRRKRFPPA